MECYAGGNRRAGTAYLYLRFMVINGKECYPRFTFNTICKFCKAKEIDLPEFNSRFTGIQDNKLSGFEDLAFFFLIAFQEGARFNKVTCDLTLDDIMEWYSEDSEKIAELLKLYTESGGEAKKQMAQP